MFGAGEHERGCWPSLALTICAKTGKRSAAILAACSADCTRASQRANAALTVLRDSADATSDSARRIEASACISAVNGTITASSSNASSSLSAASWRFAPLAEQLSACP